MSDEKNPIVDGNTDTDSISNATYDVDTYLSENYIDESITSKMNDVLADICLKMFGAEISALAKHGGISFNEDGLNIHANDRCWIIKDLIIPLEAWMYDHEEYLREQLVGIDRFREQIQSKLDELEAAAKAK